ncbi:MAG TPA: hemerythrin domain-containing protein [Candidatus Competibacteraceae bacterium]|nr:hemerythrin domain-containing protein [Candidatus Competibacteraceae bacterium]
MPELSEHFTRQHRACDDAFALAESAVARDDWEHAVPCFEYFREESEAHFNGEEQVLFPAFEACTGMRAGPTHVMRQEHAQLRGLLEAMTQALAQRDREQYLGLADTLMILLQQHNLKEEQVLYPMAEQVLAGQWPALRTALEEAR